MVMNFGATVDSIFMFPAAVTRYTDTNTAMRPPWIRFKTILLTR